MSCPFFIPACLVACFLASAAGYASAPLHSTPLHSTLQHDIVGSPKLCAWAFAQKGHFACLACRMYAANRRSQGEASCPSCGGRLEDEGDFCPSTSSGWEEVRRESRDGGRSMVLYGTITYYVYNIICICISIMMDFLPGVRSFHQRCLPDVGAKNRKNRVCASASCTNILRDASA